MSRPKVLDLYCGAGGAALGYRQAGFDVIGVDIAPQPHFPFRFYRQDALKFLRYFNLDNVAFIHASPPCQAYSQLRYLPWLQTKDYPDLLDVTRDALIATGLPYIIENVPNAPLDNPIRLCGTHFNIWINCKDGRVRQLRRHRLFESNMKISAPSICRHKGESLGVYGQGGGDISNMKAYNRGYTATKMEAEQAMGIRGMTMHEIAQAIPPIYTRHLGKQVKMQAIRWSR